MADTLTPDTESIRGQLGQGIYSLAELRAYLAYYGKAGQALYWLGAALNPVAHRHHEPDYSFSDLVSLFVVHELRQLGVRLASIRAAEARMRRITGADRPLVSQDVATDGEEVFFATERDQVESANVSRKRRTGQQASRIVIAPYLKSVRYRGGAAVSWSPTTHVVLDPLVQFGDPVIEGTRVMTSAVADVADVAGLAVAAKRLSVPLDAAEAAVRFEHALIARSN